MQPSALPPLLNTGNIWCRLAFLTMRLSALPPLLNTGTMLVPVILKFRFIPAVEKLNPVFESLDEELILEFESWVVVESKGDPSFQVETCGGAPLSVPPSTWGAGIPLFPDCPKASGNDPNKTELLPWVIPPAVILTGLKLKMLDSWLVADDHGAAKRFCDGGCVCCWEGTSWWAWLVVSICSTLELWWGSLNAWTRAWYSIFFWVSTSSASTFLSVCICASCFLSVIATTASNSWILFS